MKNCSFEEFNDRLFVISLLANIVKYVVKILIFSAQLLNN